MYLFADHSLKQFVLKIGTEKVLELGSRAYWKWFLQPFRYSSALEEKGEKAIDHIIALEYPDVNQKEKSRCNVF